MANEFDPIVDCWYQPRDKGQAFWVVTTDEPTGLIEIQYFNSDLEEIEPERWRELDIERIEAPENWSGALDIAELDDFGTEVTDTSAEDWDKPLEEITPPPFDPSAAEGDSDDPLGEGPLKEEPYDGEV